VLALPWPWRTPACLKSPADTMIMLVPADWICASIELCAPAPSATIVMTALTPMIMPSIVKAVRILFRAKSFERDSKDHQNRHVAPYVSDSAGRASNSSWASRRCATDGPS
jgi:hypothetical protein